MPTTSLTMPVRRVHECAIVPRYHSSGAAGMDLCACLPDAPMTIAPGRISLIPTGIALGIPVGFEGQVRARSGLSAKSGITPVNAPGTIDSDYRGEVFVPLINLGAEPFIVEHGMRIAQLIIAQVARAEPTVVDSLDDTERSAGGFGSTGTHERPTRIAIESQ